MDGYGVYKWSNGSVFMGSWKENNMHGCGRKFYPGGAIEEGEWVEDDFVGDFTACNQQESQRSMDIANQIAAEARMFMYKPDGEVAAKNGFVMDQAIWNKWNFKIPPQAQLVADEEKLEKMSKADAARLAKAQAALAEAEDDDEDEDDDDD